MVSVHDEKEYDFLLEFILHEVFVTGTVDKTNLLVISENEVEYLPMSYLELQLNLLDNI